MKKICLILITLFILSPGILLQGCVSIKASADVKSPQDLQDVKDLKDLCSSTIVTAQKIKSTGELMDVDFKIPVVKGLKDVTVQEKINGIFTADAEKFKAENEKNAKEDYEYSKKNNVPFRKHEVVITYDVKYNKNNILSIPVTYYNYTGGAHGMTVIVSYNFDLKTGNRLQLSDLFKPEYDYTSVIKKEVIKQINTNTEIYFPDATQTVHKMKSIDNFYIENGNLVVYFGLYEIAPYASGIREFKIPFSTFGDNLKVKL